MMQRVQELCRKLQPVLGKKIDALWRHAGEDAVSDQRGHGCVGFQACEDGFDDAGHQLFSLLRDAGSTLTPYLWMNRGHRRRYLWTGRVK